MGRKRKIVVNGSAMADEVKTSKAYPLTTSPNEKSRLHTENSSAVEGTNVGNTVLPNSNGSAVKKSKSSATNEALRRSGRLRSLVLLARSQGVKPVVEHVNLDENEKEKEEAQQSEKVNTLQAVNEENVGVETQGQEVSPRPDVKELSLEEKVNYLVRAVDEFKPKVFGRPNDGPSPDFGYKSLYIQTQKKYEALMEEHYDVVRRLEFASGQIAAYEKMKDGMGASREVILVSDLGKLTGANVNLSPQTVQNCMPNPSAAAADNPKQKKKYPKKKKAK